uniref:F-box domain-containing protein n=1 Tax=Brassica campestris TaxID=3711 RepID=A0A3P6A951_BRACM|nr:unnamed protein product [Brassica rapa]
MGWELGPDWTELTQECLLDIFSRLSLEERWTGPMFVCKTWMNRCQDPSLNLVFDLETKFQSLPGSLSCWWSPEFGDKIDSVLRSVVDRSRRRSKGGSNQTLYGQFYLVRRREVVS